MAHNFSDQYIAKNQMRLINSVGPLNYFLTIWKGSTVTFAFDKDTNNLFDLSYIDYLDEQDLEFIEDIAIKFSHCQDVTNGNN